MMDAYTKGLFRGLICFRQIMVPMTQRLDLQRLARSIVAKKFGF